MPQETPLAGRGADRIERLFTPAFIALSLAELAYFTAEGLTIPVTPLFAHGPLGATVEGVGLAVGAFSVTALVLRPYAGRAADRVGSRPLLVGGALPMRDHRRAPRSCRLAAGARGPPAAPGRRRSVLLRRRFRRGRGPRAARPDRRGAQLQLAVALPRRSPLGPMLGGLLLDAGGFTLAWLGGAVLALMAAGLAWRIPETSRPAAETWRTTHAFPARGHRALPCAVLRHRGHGRLLRLRRDPCASRPPLRWRQRGAARLRLLVVVACVAFARLPDRVPPFRLGTVALALCASGLLIVGRSPPCPGCRCRRARRRCGLHHAGDVRRHLCPRRATQRGSASGTASLFLDLAFGGGPMLLGLVAGMAGCRSRSSRRSIAAAGAVGSAALAFRSTRGRAERPGAHEGQSASA